jgi:hypothetical protein
MKGGVDEQAHVVQDEGAVDVDADADLFAYRALPGMASVARSVRIGEFTVTLQKGRRTANDWIDVTAFRIERMEAKGHVA